MKRSKKRLRNKNRTWDAPVHAWVMPARLTVIVLLFLFGLIVYGVLNEHCKTLNREIGRLESEQRVLLENLARERIRWTQLKTPRDLESALRRHGLAMSYPLPQQMVYLSPAGLPGRQGGPIERSAYASR